MLAKFPHYSSLILLDDIIWLIGKKGEGHAQGGFIIIGIEDTTLKIRGVPASRMAMTKDVILRAARQIEPVLLLDPAEPEVYVFDETQVARKATMEDIDIERVKDYLSQRSMQSQQNGRFEDLERVLLGMGCATTASNGEIVPTNAGILFFGADPQPFILQSQVVCALSR